jgi:hypothetical protein
VSPVKYKLGFYIPEAEILLNHRRENHKSYTFILHLDWSLWQITTSKLPLGLSLNRHSAVTFPKFKHKPPWKGSHFVKQWCMLFPRDGSVGVKAVPDVTSLCCIDMTFNIMIQFNSKYDRIKLSNNCAHPVYQYNAEVYVHYHTIYISFFSVEDRIEANEIWQSPLGFRWVMNIRNLQVRWIFHLG